MEIVPALREIQNAEGAEKCLKSMEHHHGPGIHNMAEFAARECERWDDNEDWDYTRKTRRSGHPSPGDHLEQVTKTWPDTS